MVASESLPTFCTLILLVSASNLDDKSWLSTNSKLGRGLELQHIRWNSECGVHEELAPIDLNPNYDFDFQQTTYLPNEVTVLPVSNIL